MKPKHVHTIIALLLLAIAPLNAQGTDPQDALTALETWLMTPKDSRPSIETLPQIDVPLDVETAEKARDIVADDYITHLKSVHREDFDNDFVTVDGLTVKFITKFFGDPNVEDGRSLIISMHGGIFADDAGNDQQWENQKSLYNDFPNDYVLIVPRVPINMYNGWHIWQTERAFDLIISLAVEKYNLNRNKIILVGYSAGGDGVYELSPRMGDVISASGMFAGTNNFSNPFNLHRVTWAGRIGELDTAFNRNNVLLEYGQQIAALQNEHDDFIHDVALEPGAPHWMNNAERAVFPILFGAERNPFHEKILWKQSGWSELPQRTFYNLKSEAYKPGTEAIVTFDRSSSRVNIEKSGYTNGELEIYIRDENLDMDQAITIGDEQTTFYQGTIARTIRTIWETSELNEGDPDRIYYGSVLIENENKRINLAPEASTIEVSSEFSADFDKNKLVDGFTTTSGEWASQGEQEPSLRLEWSEPIVTSQIALYDRPNLSDNIGELTIRFSDGSSITQGALNNDGQITEIAFEERETDWIEIDITTGEGPNVGFLEVEVFGEYAATLDVGGHNPERPEFLVYKKDNHNIQAELKGNVTTSARILYTLYDMQGRVLQSIQSVQPKTTIQRTGLSPGAYIITVQKNDAQYSRKFIID